MEKQVMVDGTLCNVESRNKWVKEDPAWEIMAPDGYLFDDELTGLLCFDMKDVRERAACHKLTPYME